MKFINSVDKDSARLKINKRQRERYATATTEQKEARSQKRKATYAKKKVQLRLVIQSRCIIVDEPREVVSRNASLNASFFDHVVSGNNKSQVLGAPTLFEEGSSSQHVLYTPSQSLTTKRQTASNTHIEQRNIHLLTNINDSANIIPIPNTCPHCRAKRFLHEPKSSCCSNGTVSLHYEEPPSDLYELFISQNEESQSFRKHIRSYNNMLAFTSLGVKYDKSLASAIGSGIYVFRVQGQLSHFINTILPTAGTCEYLQLYFYDPLHEIENRARICSGFDASIIQKLITILSTNPYCIFFRGLRHEENLKDVKIVIRTDDKLDQRIYNRPSVSDIALIWRDHLDGDQISPRDIIVHGNDVHSHRVQYYFGCYDPLQYVLLCPRGEIGWHWGIERCSTNKRNAFCKGLSTVNPRKFSSPESLLEKEAAVLHAAKASSSFVSIREYYAYKLQIRENQRNLALRAGRLFQQYIVDMYVKIETSRLDFFRLNQRQIRADLYQGLIEAVAAGETRASNIGKKIILPSSFIGGPRDMTRRYLDAMTLVQRYGRPDLFLTITCNPSWPEIKRELEVNELPQDRPDLVARIFRAKMIELKNEIVKKNIFGPVAAYAFVVEFQKRGLPHVHMLIIMEKNAKLKTPSQYDKIVCAEIPDTEANPHLYCTVRTHMMHGPCGPLNEKNVCMRKGKCRSRYPKSLRDTTIHGENEYPLYRRPDNGRFVHVRGHDLNNAYVVPYNPYLLAKFDCHINVEICSTVKAVKYIYKYIYKGHDRVAFNILGEQDIPVLDEIQAYQSGRWISPPEAAWRIFGFQMYAMRPPVLALHLHLEDQQSIAFDDSSDIAKVISSEKAGKTMLTEFFHSNKTNPKAIAGQYLYIEFPEYFVWNVATLSWTERKSQISIGRINSANPIEGERYYLRLLLSHVRGPTSFKNLRTYNGSTKDTFREACKDRALILTDEYIKVTLQEACSFKMPRALRHMFSSLLVYCNPVNPKQLWEEFEGYLSEDFTKDNKHQPHIVKKKVFLELETCLKSMSKSITDFGMVESLSEILNNQEGKELEDEYAIPVSEDDLLSISRLNECQAKAFRLIMQHITCKVAGTFFIDGPAGTGKTFLYKALLATLRSKNQIALATATSGVAASLLPGGRTAHSRFKIPINTDSNKTCNVSKRSGLADLIRSAVLIIWDEASMANKQSVEAVDMMLKDIQSCNLPFGGKVIVFGGDFRQVLPVVRRGSKEDAINASLVRSELWSSMQKLSLTENMRARLDPSFSSYLMHIGNGTETTITEDDIQLPQSMLIISESEDNSLNKLIKFTFPNLGNTSHISTSTINHAILTPRNDSVDAINNIVMNQIPGETKVYRGFDETINPALQSQYEDLLHKFTPTGFPPYQLELKLNCPIMLTRNLNPSLGLCNGTIVICHHLEPNLIHGKIAVGNRAGEDVFIHRIPLLPPSYESYPVPFKRTQFPVRPSFCMTINKAQGQTLDIVGLYLPQPVFSHGQLYVALSRAKIATSIKVYTEHSITDSTPHGQTSNVVYREILAAVHPVTLPSVTTTP